VIDIHSHFLPGVDDGPRDDVQALALMAALAADGVERVVATPHLYQGHFDNSKVSIETGFERFRGLLPVQQASMLVHAAAEVRFDEQVPRLLRAQQLPLLSAKGAYKTVLLELPDTLIPLGAGKLVELLLAHGVHPVIAHPERNRVVREQPGAAKELVRMGCHLQVTAGAFLGDFGEKVWKAVHALVDAGLVSAVASDAHNVSSRRPRMGAACNYIRQRWGAAAARQLTHTGPAALCGLA
jgi:tyrosine-protein phosphatase YwqE